MAEQFLEEIYSDAIIVDDLNETIALIARTDYYKARIVFNRGMERLEKLLPKYALEDLAAANEIQECALNIVKDWSDWSRITGLIRGKLIPQLYRYMELYNSINVCEGNYNIISSDSGFLTVRDIEDNIYLHDTHNPMQEAGDIADMMYKPEAERYILFGCGLGYLPYKLWKKSDEAALIVIYEDDTKMIEYARNYGVLDWIDNGCLEIKQVFDYENAIQRFSEEVDFRDNSKVSYITPYKQNKYRYTFGGDFLALTHDIAYFWKSYGLNETNFWKNRKLETVKFQSLKEKLWCDNWIIVAAGPSLNYSMDFVKENSKYCNVVAVNTVLRRFSKEGMVPDLSVAADPFWQIPKHLDGIEEFTTNIPMIADWVLCWKYAYRYRGEKCFVPTPAIETIKQDVYVGDDIWDVQGTVSALAVEAAIRLGAKKIFLVGLDLAFPGGEVHAKDMPHEKISYKNNAIVVSSMNGGMVETTATFNEFRFGIEKIISRNPKVEFINMSKDGAVIKGAKCGY